MKKYGWPFAAICPKNLGSFKRKSRFLWVKMAFSFRPRKKDCSKIFFGPFRIICLKQFDLLSLATTPWEIHTAKNLTKIAQNHSKLLQNSAIFPSIHSLYRQNPASNKPLCAKFSTLYKKPCWASKTKTLQKTFLDTLTILKPDFDNRRQWECVLLLYECVYVPLCEEVYLNIWCLLA